MFDEGCENWEQGPSWHINTEGIKKKKKAKQQPPFHRLRTGQKADPATLQHGLG